MRKEANRLKRDISDYLKGIGLTLSLEKTLITNARAGRAKFLGVNIKRMASDKGQIKSIRVNNKSRRVPTGNL